MAISDPAAAAAVVHSGRRGGGSVNITEIPVIITTEVSLSKLSAALARAGLVGRRDAARGVLVIEPVPAPCMSCGGTGLDEDALCEFCDGAGREGRRGPLEPSVKLSAPPAII